MKKSVYLIIIGAATAWLFAAAGCSGGDPVERPEEPAPEPSEERLPPPVTDIDPDDPARSFPGVGREDWWDECEGSSGFAYYYPNIYYTYICYCNNSNHDIFIWNDFGAFGEGCHRARSGEKYTTPLTGEYIPPYADTGRLCRFEDIVSLEVIFDTEDPIGHQIQRYAIYAKAANFKLDNRSGGIDDPTRWHYVAYNDNVACWTLIFTDDDYDWAVRESEARTYDPRWPPEVEHWD